VPLHNRDVFLIIWRNDNRDPVPVGKISLPRRYLDSHRNALPVQITKCAQLAAHLRSRGFVIRSDVVQRFHDCAHALFRDGASLRLILLVHAAASDNPILENRAPGMRAMRWRQLQRKIYRIAAFRLRTAEQQIICGIHVGECHIPIIDLYHAPGESAVRYEIAVISLFFGVIKVHNHLTAPSVKAFPA
jgi:hypothetical protein